MHHEKAPTLFTFTLFNITKERATELIVQLHTHLIHECACECGLHLDKKKAVSYARQHMNEWVQSHAEANFLYYELGKVISNRLYQLGMVISKGETVEATALKIRDTIDKIIDDATAPLN